MRHDYNLPPDYEKRVEENTMAQWYTLERNRRQAVRSGILSRYDKDSERVERRLDARGWVSLKGHK